MGDDSVETDVEEYVRQLEKDNRELSEQLKIMQVTEQELMTTRVSQSDQLRIYKELHSVGKKLNATFDLIELARVAVEFIVYQLNFQRCLLLIADADGGYDALAHDGFYDDAEVAKLKDVLPLSRDAVAAILSDSDTTLYYEGNQDEACREYADGFSMNELVVRSVGGETSATTALFIAGNSADSWNFHERVRPNTTAMLGLANLATQTATAISNARFYSELVVERQLLERKVSERTRELSQAMDDLKKLDDLKSQFFANISHELRTPLMLLLGPLQVLSSSPDDLPNGIRRQLALSTRNGRRLLRQINLLLDFAKADAGKMALELSPEDPVALARDLVEESAPAARASGLVLSMTSEESVGLVELDRERIEQVLLNLIGNAIKFTPKGGRVDVSVEDATDELVIAVRDSGIGIPESEIPHLFESFRQVERGSSKRGTYRVENKSGTGLGLALVKQIVDLHGGRIDVLSAEGEGTTFRVVLPAVNRTASRTEHPAIATSGEPQSRGIDARLADIEADHAPTPAEDGVATLIDPDLDERPLLLLVDDHADVLTYLCDLLRDTYRLVTASDGQEGIDRALALRPDLVISDVMMPRKSGFELVEELKAHHLTRSTPIMLLTARGGVQGAVEGLSKGADDYLSKPFDPQELGARVVALLRVTELERRLAIMNRRMESELEAAQLIQASLMPAGGLEMPGYEIAGRYMPASQLGGDFFDYFPFKNRGHGAPQHLGIALGDVTGHGAASALITAVAKATLQTYIGADVTPDEVIQTLGRVIYDSCRGARSMTFLYGILDLDTAVLSYSNAGQSFPLVYNRIAARARMLPLPGVPLGVDRECSCPVKQDTLQRGDIVVLYSDGVIEAAAPDGRPYGTKRLAQMVAAHENEPAIDIAKAVIADSLASTGLDHCTDDMTVVVLKYNG